MKTSRSTTLPLIVLILAASRPASISWASSKNDVDEIGKRKVAHRSIVSQEKEIAIGTQFAAEIDRSAKLIRDPVITEYVNRIAQNLARNSDLTIPLTVKVIDDPTINAITLPGGFIYINSGLLLAADEGPARRRDGARNRSRGGLSLGLPGNQGDVASVREAAAHFNATIYPVYLGVSQALNFGEPLAFSSSAAAPKSRPIFSASSTCTRRATTPISMWCFSGKYLRKNGARQAVSRRFFWTTRLPRSAS